MTVHIVAGGQYGSEGKGAFTAALTKKARPAAIVRVAGPNAGHTAYDDKGNKWSLRQIPVGAVVDFDTKIVIGQGSEIDIEVLEQEINALEDSAIPIRDRLIIDRYATVIEDEHKAQEAAMVSASTKKGIGAARAGRLLRTAARMCDYAPDLPIGDTLGFLRKIHHDGDIVIEGTQGYGLGMHTDSYPFTTSSNCRPGDFLAMTGLQPGEMRVRPWIVFRSHPIRIAGPSGPLNNETTWGEVGRETEYTTVTKLPRRVGLWDQKLADAAMTAAGPEAIPVFMFLDYLHPQFAGETQMTADVRTAIDILEDMFGFGIWYVGTGPDTGVWVGRTRT